MSLGISLTFARLFPSDGQAGSALLTRGPVDAYRKQASNIVSPRLACVKPVASVHPEPGSNSPLYNIIFTSCLIAEAIGVCCLYLGRISFTFIEA